tara:strand:+ start:119 stop:658 length:540 start_codon:yes stop_codon:yes gene_type:complete
MIRFLDFVFAVMGIIILLPIFILIWIIGLFENGSPIFTQTRIGYLQKNFTLIKFRTMKKDTISVATHLVKDPVITRYGIFLRKTKFDEIPQLWNVLIGDMSFVGPRPCLLNQTKLISERKKRGVFKFRPGITGLAQISGITMRTPTLLAKTDFEMNKKMNLYYYFYYILKTLLIISFKK